MRTAMALATFAWSSLSLRHSVFFLLCLFVWVCVAVAVIVYFWVCFGLLVVFVCLGVCVWGGGGEEWCMLKRRSIHE